MKPPIVIPSLTAAEAEQLKLIFQVSANVTVQADGSGTFTLIAVYSQESGAGLPPSNPNTVTATPPVQAEPLSSVVPAASSPTPAFVDELVRQCVAEWEYFGGQVYDENGAAVSVGHKEQEVGYAARIGVYWKEGTSTQGVDGTSAGWPWSAAFISWVVKQAGASDRFRYSTKHSVYISQAIRDRISNRVEAGYWCERLNEYQPTIGDIVCWGREPDVDYDHQKEGAYDGHCDVVVDVTPESVWIIGGNIGNSVTKRPIRRSPNGYLLPIVVNGENLFGIMRCRIGQPQVLPTRRTVASPPPAVSSTSHLPAPLTSASLMPNQPIAWGKILEPALKSSVIALAIDLGCDPSHLSSCMAFETGETFDPRKQNPTSKATGLIQFMPQTATSLGTSIEALLAMTAVQQMHYVSKYFSPYKNRFKTMSDVYMAILWPKAVGVADATIIFSKGTIYYEQNAGLDVNSDGVVTKGEAVSMVQARLDKGLRVGYIG
ncbi:DUF2272 domain-containing protein [Mesorhizobium sp. M0119]|uniref:DUF2272 domain-containing protein n=1 Tax=Mesorhizobium sp. M0119 TaxID=2956885 RepID=UPI00333C04BE